MHIIYNSYFSSFIFFWYIYLFHSINRSIKQTLLPVIIFHCVAEKATTTPFAWPHTQPNNKGLWPANISPVHGNTLWKWNVIIYANVTVSLTMVSNKLNVPFFSVLFQWEKFRRALWNLVSKKRAKIQEKDACLLCGRVSASLNAKPLPDFSFPNSRFSTEKVVAFVQVHVFVSSRIRQYVMPSISQWLRIRCHLYVWHRYTLK